MIAANELRIGNLINTEYGMLSIHASMLVAIVNNGFNVEPIPLTPEILEKCGFVKMNAGWLKSRLSFYDKSQSESNDTYFGEHGTRYGQFQFKYLHQLQNLYYALTGEELEVHLP